MRFYYVYILTDERTGSHYYIGYTENLESRLAQHNAGEVAHTSKLRPWKIHTAVCFTSEDKARAFETYLKSGSGRAFAKRHL